MTHDEEEVQHYIPKLQEKVHQISLLQTTSKNEMEVLKRGAEAKMDGLKKGIEAKINGNEAKMDDIDEKMKDNMEDMKNDLKSYIEGLKDRLTNLFQEMIPNGKKIVEETHNENKIIVNRDFINSNFGWKTHNIPKMYMRKFDGKDPITWILQMEQYLISIM